MKLFVVFSLITILLVWFLTCFYAPQLLEPTCTEIEQSEEEVLNQKINREAIRYWNEEMKQPEQLVLVKPVKEHRVEKH